uniref:Uncharacterized protein n=1 Tax=Rhizophora mucronata TaxID=61149 RepID=A0A2P2IT33_RHIMU
MNVMVLGDSDIICAIICAYVNWIIYPNMISEWHNLGHIRI